MTVPTRIPLRELPQFNEIDRNVVLFKRVARGIESMECQCSQLSLDCGTYQCLNRGSQMECPGSCKVGPKCQNQKLQKKEYAKLGASWTKEKGYGILADEHITTGKLVNEYVGEIISIAEANSRSSQYKQSKERHHYIMGIGNGAAIDATNQGNLSRFINHSCEPNCVVEKWTVNRETRAGIFARRDILESEEVTIDYAFEGFGSFLQKCLCGEKNCSGFIGGLFKKRKSNGNAGLMVSSRIASLPKIPKKSEPSQPLKREVPTTLSETALSPIEEMPHDESFENSGFAVNGKQAAKEVVQSNRFQQYDNQAIRERNGFHQAAWESVKNPFLRHHRPQYRCSPVRRSCSRKFVLHRPASPKSEKFCPVPQQKVYQSLNCKMRLCRRRLLRPQGCSARCFSLELKMC